MPIIRQEVELPLSEEQKTTLGEELAGKELEWNKVDGEKKESAKTFNDTLNGLRAEITEMSDALTRGVRKQLMDCRERLNPETGKVDILSADGKRVLATRDARPAESQLGIPFSEPPAKGYAIGNLVTVENVPKAAGAFYQIVSLGEEGETPILAELELVRGQRGAPKKLSGIDLEYLAPATFEPADQEDEDPEEDETGEEDED